MPQQPSHQQPTNPLLPAQGQACVVPAAPKGPQGRLCLPHNSTQAPGQCTGYSLCLEGVTPLCHLSWEALCVPGTAPHTLGLLSLLHHGAMQRLRPLKDSCPHWHRLATLAVSWRL